MPIFQDPDRRYDSYEQWRHSTKEPYAPVWRAGSEKDVRMSDASSSRPDMETESSPTLHTNSREELIRRIKRGESPTWVPSPAVSNIPRLCRKHLYSPWTTVAFVSLLQTASAYTGLRSAPVQLVLPPNPGRLNRIPLTFTYGNNSWKSTLKPMKILLT